LLGSTGDGRRRCGEWAGPEGGGTIGEASGVKVQSSGGGGDSGRRKKSIETEYGAGVAQ
jgi:hypothetical protein